VNISPCSEHTGGHSHGSIKHYSHGKVATITRCQQGYCYRAVPSPTPLQPLFQHPLLMTSRYYSAINTSMASSTGSRDQRAKLASTSPDSSTSLQTGCISHKPTAGYRQPNAELCSPQFYTCLIVWTSDKPISEIRILRVCSFPSEYQRDNQGIDEMVFKRSCKGCNRWHDKRSLLWLLLIFVCIPLTLPHSCWIPESIYRQSD